MCPRKYDASRRRAAIQVTRNRILEGARAIVGGKGDLGTFSVDAVARKAGVARMTVYYQFKSRAGLLDALADYLAERGGMAGMREVFAARTFDAGLQRLIEVFVGFWASDRATLRRLRAMAVVFPSDGASPRDRDAWRREAVTNLLRRHELVPARLRAPGSEGLIDALTALTSFEMFDLLQVGSRPVPDVISIIHRLAAAEVQDHTSRVREGTSTRALSRRANVRSAAGAVSRYHDA
jgi:AcrR family transcriptional regulator